MAKKACCTKEGLNRGAWTSQEDKLLSDYIMTHGLGRWRTLPANAGLNRCGKSCRLRWLNYLRPDIKRGNITEEEEELIIRLHKLVGNRWSLIAGRLPGRTDNEIKNYWNTYLKKKVSGDVTGPYVPSKCKKVLCSKLSMEKKQGSGISQVNVIRTKAIRCTRPLFIDTNHTSQIDSSASAQTPAAPIGDELLPSFKEHEGEDPFPSHMEPNRLCMKQFTQCSAFLQESQDGSHMSNSVHECDDDNGIITPIDEENYVDEVYYGMIDEGEGLSSFLDMDSWDSLILPH